MVVRLAAGVDHFPAHLDQIDSFGVREVALDDAGERHEVNLVPRLALGGVDEAPGRDLREAEALAHQPLDRRPLDRIDSAVAERHHGEQCRRREMQLVGAGRLGCGGATPLDQFQSEQR